MHCTFKTLLVALTLSTLAFAQISGDVVITTRDGKTVSGRVLSETQRGYLLRTATGTQIVVFTDILDLQQVGSAPSVAPSVVPQSPVVSTPLPPPPPMPASPAPIVRSAEEVPPPPPERPTVSLLEDAQDPLAARRGFHFGLGVGAGVNLLGVSASLEGHFDFNFGLPGLRLGLTFMPSYQNAAVLEASFDPEFQLHFGRTYALGVGVRLGVAVSGVAYAFVAPKLTPVIIKLGDRGQHQLSLWTSMTMLSSVTYDYWPTTYLLRLHVIAGYSFSF